jgi:MFS family permease
MERQRRWDLIWFFALLAAVAMGNGMSDAVYANYFKDAYHVDAVRRAFLEFPRELPGMLCLLVLTSLSALGEIRVALIAQILAALGLTALGLLTPSFGLMCVFLFINSMGMHLFFPLQDSIGMALAEPDRVGRRMGQYGSLRTAVSCGAGVLVFFGFRFGFFSFVSPVKWIFLVGAAAFAVAVAAAAYLLKEVGPGERRKRGFHLTFRKAYRSYYFLAMLNGVQKQIAYVFGTWAIIELLGKGADVMSLLTIAASFLGVFFIALVGRWLDKLGIKAMLYLDALTFIGVYVFYGVFIGGVAGGKYAAEGWAGYAIMAMFVLDRLSMQVGVVRSVYLRDLVRRINAPGEEVAAALSTGISLDHIVSILAAQISGWVWVKFGPQYVFFAAATFSLGNLYVAIRMKPGPKGG